MLPVSATQDRIPSAAHLDVIVADDVEEITKLARQWLEDAGHSVTCASSGQEVIRLMKHQHVDVAVVDVLMPDGDGLDVVMAAKRFNPEMRVLAISGGGSYMTGGECLRIAKGIGADGVLAKPFGRKELVDAVGKLAAGRPQA